MNGNIGVSNIVAGFNVDPNVFLYSERPNQSPEACGITVHWPYDDDQASNDSPTVTTSNEDELKIEIGCVVESKELFGMINEDNTANNKMHRHKMNYQVQKQETTKLNYKYHMKRDGQKKNLMKRRKEK